MSTVIKPQFFASWARHVIMLHYISGLQISQKRHIFSIIRHIGKGGEDIYLPQFGLTLGEFATYNLLNETMKRLLRNDNK